MKVSNLDLIINFEGFSGKPYLCPAGIPTIGFGSTRYPDGTKVTIDDKEVTKEEALSILRGTLESFEKTVNTLVKPKLTQNQFDALVSFVYNVGSGNFSSSTLLVKLNQGKYLEAANEFLKWNKAGGKFLSGLTRRRAAERELFLKEDYL